MKHRLTCYEPLQRETQESFNKFLIYRDLKPHKRSIRQVCEILSENEFDQKLFKSLQKLSSKWCWVERCKIYDADQQLQLVKKREDLFTDLTDVLLQNIEGLIKYANNLLSEVIQNPIKENGDQYSLMSRIRMTKDVSNLLKEAHELLCNLCGRPSSYSSFEFDGLIDVNATVIDNETEEEKLERYADYFKRIDTKGQNTAGE